ncbi:MAG TPA: class I SAM-dependent methyltransferase [Anaerolineae bacterium]|nr:class I SAM-dependent methyltransferase [Anaerolineae bacterium]
MNDYTPFAELYDLFYDDFEEDLEMYRGFAERTGGPILEIGSGTGRVALALAAEGHTIVSLELSDAMRAVAQRKAAELELTDRVTFIVGDMRRFKIDQHFGLIIVPLNTFLHNLTLDDQLATLACCKKHLRPGGLLVLDCFNPDPAHAADDGRLIVQRSVNDRETGQPAVLLLSRATDWNNQLQEITYLIDRVDRNGIVQRTILPTTYRFIFRHEMRLLLKAGGLDLKDEYGSYDLDPVEIGSDKLIVVATPA